MVLYARPADPTFLSATTSELKTADIFAHLASMPKNVDPEHDPMVRDDLATLDPTALLAEAASGDGKAQLTQRELARLKNKQALVESIKKREAEKLPTAPSEEERDSKKVKAHEGDSAGQDVAMNET